jgi:ATP-dependent RNA helicase RhlE
MNGFRSGDIRLLVATDIAARGIDVEGISHVINFDLPNVPETYVHRIGRTGRAGAAGIAVSFCDVEERPYLMDIERLTKQHVPRVEDHAYRASQPPPPETDLTRRGGGQPSQQPQQRKQGGGGRGGSRGRRGGGGRGRAGARPAGARAGR